MEFSFAKNSLRVKKARFARVFSGKRYYFWLAALYVLLVLSMVLIATGEKGGYILAAGFLAASMLFLWYRWDLKILPPDIDIANVSSPVVLDKILSAEILRVIKPGISAQRLVQGLSGDWGVRFVFSRLLLPQTEINNAVDIHSDMDIVWRYALQLTQHYNLKQIPPSVVVVATLLTTPSVDQYLGQYKLKTEDVLNVLDWQVRLDTLMNKLQQKRFFGGMARDWSAGYTPLLNQFGSNISHEIEVGGYQHMYLQTHSSALNQLLITLSQPSNNGIALVGDTGSGKTSLAYALADELLTGNHKALRYYQVVALNSSLIVSESKRSGNLEALILYLTAEASRAGNIVLFLDDAQSFLADQAGSVDISNILLPILRNSHVRLILALNPQDWQYVSTNMSELAAALNYQAVTEPDEETVIRVMQHQALDIETQANITISYQGVREAYRLADRYIHEQAFPGRGISLLRQAANYAPDGWVTAETVQSAIEGSLGVKVATASDMERVQLLSLEDELHKRMINQTYAVKVVSDALRRARAGVSSPDRPVGSFLFLGPTGVGKTELSKALADIYFGGADRIVRIDMSEYNQPNSTGRLLAPSGDAETFLTQIRANPFTVVLLDEVEKAAPEVLNLLLQLLDEGHLTDTANRKISFKDAIIIATSNAGADIIRQNITEGKNLEDFSAEFIDQLIDNQQFKPELINRFDEVVLFRPLNAEELVQIVGLLIREINKTLATQRITVELTPAAVEAIVNKGYDARLGARPMRRMVQRSVENVIAKRMLENKLAPGGQAVLDVKDLELA